MVKRTTHGGNLGGPVNVGQLILSYCIIDMDFRMFFFCGLHTIVLEIDFKQNKSIMENFDILWWQKNLGRPTDRLGGSLGRPDDL